jgi:hypothetical protein
MSTPPHEDLPRPPAATTDRLAEAMRAGCETRRFVPALTVVGEFFDRVAPHAIDLAWNGEMPAPVDVPQIISRKQANLLPFAGRFPRLAKLLSYFLPGWGAQTRFNLHVCDAVEHLVALHVRQSKYNQVLLAELQRPLETTLLALQAEIAQENRLQGTVAAQLQELRQAISVVLNRLGSSHALAPPSSPPTVPLSRALLEEVFLHAHLPPAPARVLFLGYDPPPSVAASGYELAHDNPAAAIVATPAELHRAERALTPDGRLLLMGASVDAIPSSYQVMKVSSLVSVDGGWAFSADTPSRGTPALIVARRAA